MNEQEKIILQIELVKSIIDKTKDYGSGDQPLTMSIFREFMREVLTEKQLELVKSL